MNLFVGYLSTFLTTVLVTDDEFEYEHTGPVSADTEVSDLLGSAATWLSAMIGIVAVIFLILGGIQYASAFGDSEKLNKAKRTITYAIIGVALASISYLIVPMVTGLFQ